MEESDDKDEEEDNDESDNEDEGDEKSGAEDSSDGTGKLYLPFPSHNVFFYLVFNFSIALSNHETFFFPGHTKTIQINQVIL